MEEFVLTDPVVPPPPPATTKYRVVGMLLDWGMTPTSLGLVQITLVDDVDRPTIAQYTGDEAKDLMKWLNTANFSTTSMQKRILQKLENDGKLPPGEVTGTPDAPTMT